MDRPDWSRLHSMVDDIQRAIGSLDETQRQIAQVTGVGQSADRLIRAVVGPRGQLVDLEIDPRVFRNPDSRGLADAILTAVDAAIGDANAKTGTILDRAVPPELRRNGNLSEGRDRLGDFIHRRDADLRTTGGTDG